VPGWSTSYLDYKALKKIVSSLTKKRLDTVSPATTVDSTGSVVFGGSRGFANGSNKAVAQPALWEPSGTELVQPLIPTIVAPSSEEDRGPAFQEHKAAFFSRLELELKKVWPAAASC
jgi:CDK inhibitor PHO81